jgi:hypothetical protein
MEPQDIVMEESSPPLADIDTTYQPTSKKQTKLSLDHERSGLIEFQVVKNDSEDYSMIILTGLKNIFQKREFYSSNLSF